MRKGQARGQQLEPIARWEGDQLLMDTRALTIHLGISDREVRRYPQHRVKTDERTGAPLYDATAVGAARATVRTRASRGRRRVS